MKGKNNVFGLKVFQYLLKIPAVIFIIAFVVLNQQDTTLYISPLMDPLVLPLWIMGLVLFGVGFLVGALLLWLNSWPIRKELKQAKKDAKKTQEKYEELASLRPDTKETENDLVVIDHDTASTS